MIHLIAAVSENGVIGAEGRIPWSIPEDLAHFKELTMGHTIVMGRRTFEGIGKALPGRQNIVLSHSLKGKAEAGEELPKDCEIAGDWDEVWKLAAHPEVFIIGGQSLYEEMLPKADVLDLTEVHISVEGDTFFPAIPQGLYEEITREEHEGATNSYAFVTWRKKTMLSFECDYTEGAHEAILQRLLETNRVQVPGYGNDPYTQSAKEKIRQACQCPDADIFFLNGGTQTNMIAINTMLQPYEGVVAVQSGHINVHEAGAIEHTGHKVMALPAHMGKMDAKELEELLQIFWADGNKDHMVFPGMVYISHPTEYGTLYTKEELTNLSEVCHKYHIPLYMDGARLGYGLMSSSTDVTLPMIAQLCDAFYIGGTKVGALNGEALVFTKKNQPAHFLTRVKQLGGLSAKGRLIGIQFDTLFTDELYFKIARSAIELAERVKKEFTERGYRLFMDSPTNQQFIILENEELKKIQEQLRCEIWEPFDEKHTVVRFATSWATTTEMVDTLFEIVDRIRKGE